MGKPVKLLRPFDGPLKRYEPGDSGVLTGISITDGRSGFYLLVALDQNDDGYLENFEVSEVRPADQKVSFSLDIEHGIMFF
jgi:hypothetical protein